MQALAVFSFYHRCNLSVKTFKTQTVLFVYSLVQEFNLISADQLCCHITVIFAAMNTT